MGVARTACGDMVLRAHRHQERELPARRSLVELGWLYFHLRPARGFWRRGDAVNVRLLVWHRCSRDRLACACCDRGSAEWKARRRMTVAPNRRLGVDAG